MTATVEPERTATVGHGPDLRPVQPHPKNKWVQVARKKSIPYLFLLPSGTLFLAFSLIPIGAAFWFSFNTGALAVNPRFVGLDNYEKIVQDELFWTALRNTGVFTLGTVPTSMAVGLLLALLLNRPMPGRVILRTLFFAPMVASGVGVAVVMSWIFNYDYGVVDNAIEALGGSRIPWLTSPNLAMVTVVLAVLWSRIGFCMVLYLAALQAVPETLNEAATLDGAGPWKRFRYVTLPLLSPTTFFLLIINVVFSLQVFDLLFVLTGGGPGFATTVLVQYVFRTAFAQGNMGYASAIGVIFTLMLIAFTLLRYRSSRNSEDVV